MTRSFEFALRNRWLGRIRLRSGLPKLKDPLAPTREGQFYQLLLTQLFGPTELQSVGTIVDLGSRNGSYLPAVAGNCPHATVNAIELDGGRRYWNGFRRADYGKAYALAIRQGSGNRSQYLWKDIFLTSASGLEVNKEGSVLFTVFYPFVSVAPCASWGLPLRFAQYDKFVEQIHRLSKELHQGLPRAPIHLLAAHQGPWEADIARQIYEKSRFLIVGEKTVEPSEYVSLWPSKYPVFLFRLEGRE